MVEDAQAQEEQERPLPQEVEETQVGLSDDFIREIRELLDQNYIDRIQELCRDLPAADMAELLTKLDAGDRRKAIEVLEEDLAAEAYSHLDHEVLNDLLQYMSPKSIAAIISDLESDDAIKLIDTLDEDRHASILRYLNRKLRAVVEEGLTYPEDSAGRMMEREFVAIPQFWTVGKTVDYLRTAAKTLPERFYNIFVVDAMHRFVGAANLSNILCAQRSVKVDALLTEDHASIPVGMDREDVAMLFKRKSLLSAPVIDEDGRLVGVITVDDVVDVIDEEAEEDFLQLGGVTDSDIHRPVLATTRSRFFWLLINLFTAIAASAVVGFFEETISQLALLAVLMPIVASMGGNTGTQTLAVTIRALATKDVSAANSLRVIGKECLVGLLNGILFAVIMGFAVFLWFDSAPLGAVISVAMVLNLFVAGFSGAMIPILLERAGFDPAPAAGIFLTTVTDIVGFFVFLGLASRFLL